MLPLPASTTSALLLPVALGSTWTSIPHERVWLDPSGTALLLRSSDTPLSSAPFHAFHDS